MVLHSIIIFLENTGHKTEQLSFGIQVVEDFLFVKYNRAVEHAGPTFLQYSSALITEGHVRRTSPTEKKTTVKVCCLHGLLVSKL